MYQLPQSILDELATYLGSRPYVEVYQLIQKLSKLEKLEIESDKFDPDASKKEKK